MPQDNSQPSLPATTDELAALFLCGRDSPCPSCNYNRRDGTTSTCPECGEQLRLIGVDKAGRSREYAIVKALLLVLLVFVVIELFQSSLTLGSWIYMIINTGMGILPSGFLIAQIIMVITWTALLVFIIRRRRALRNNTPISIKKFIAPIAILLGVNYLIKIGYVIMMIL